MYIVFSCWRSLIVSVVISSEIFKGKRKCTISNERTLFLLCKAEVYLHFQYFSLIWQQYQKWCDFEGYHFPYTKKNSTRRAYNIILEDIVSTLIQIFRRWNLSFFSYFSKNLKWDFGPIFSQNPIFLYWDQINILYCDNKDGLFQFKSETVTALLDYLWQTKFQKAFFKNET